MDISQICHIALRDDEYAVSLADGLEVYLDREDAEDLSFLWENPQSFGFIHIYIDDRELWLRFDRIVSIIAEENLGKLKYNTLDGWELTFQVPIIHRGLPDFFDLVSKYERYLRNAGDF